MKAKKKLCVGCKSEQYIWKNHSGNRYCKPCWHRIKDKVNSIKTKPVLKKNTNHFMESGIGKKKNHLKN